MTTTFDYEPISSNGRLRARITARRDNHVVHQDTIDLGSAVSRQRFARNVAERADIPQTEAEQTLLAMAEQQATQPAVEASLTEAPNDPHRLAAVCMAQRWQTVDGKRRLAHWRDEFHEWTGVIYRPLDDSEMTSAVTAMVKREFERLAAEGVSDRDHHQFRVTRRLVGDVTQALAGMVQVPSTVEQPAWIGELPPVPPDELLAMPGGIIDVAALLEDRPHRRTPTPEFFTGNGLEYEFDPAADCPRWRQFLTQLWPDDVHSVELLQEWTGYCLLPDTRQQKILLVHGPKRSGKGTICRVLSRVIGLSNVVSPTLRSLQGEFGLQPLLGKLVATITDARLSGRHDLAGIVETLLSISGEDRVTANRKFRSPVTTKLPTRISIYTNELPNLRDVSGALASRLLIVCTRQSWLGQEDVNLTDRLLDELAGILNWAIEGLRRLRQRGHFVQPAAAQQLVAQMDRMSSPIRAFLDDCCVVGPEATVSRSLLYLQWQGWCAGHGILNSGSEATFGRDLRAVLPGLEDVHPTVGGRRVWCYRGLQLRPLIASSTSRVGCGGSPST